MKVNRVNNTKELLKAGVLMVILSLIFLSTKITFDSRFNGRGFLIEPKTVGNLIVDENALTENEWSKYIIEEYSIGFSYPSFLSIREFRNNGGYDFFIRFEENNASQGKGIALGINKLSLDEEVEKIKSEIGSQPGVELVDETDVGVEGGKGKILEFKSGDDSMEDRSFLIIKKGEYSYSFSTVPAQLQKLIDTINFLE